MDIDAVLSGMTLREKASLLAGSAHWSTAPLERHGVRSLVLSDGPHGLRHQVDAADHLGINESLPATAFPTASALACSFDPDLARRVGDALGAEAREQGVDVVLGPGVNMKRSPLCGRNFEYFSEDPLLAGDMATGMVQGIQGRGVAACVKHLAANNQEHARLVSDSVIDEQALREIYLAPFERVVRRARPWTIMSAYNKLNGEYCSQSAWLLDGVLRGEWGFDGVVISDWGAMSRSVPSVAAGLDLCMPGPRPDHVDAVVEAVESGALASGAVDAAAERMLSLVDRIDQCRHPAPAPANLRRVARDAAAESAVLLKNDGLLPLSMGERVAVIGAFALEPRYQGAGSSKINPSLLDSAWEAMVELGARVEYAAGYDRSTGETTPELLDEAVALAASRDAAVVFAGLPDRYESEGFDRKLMCMPAGHRELVERVCRANPRTVVVLQGGSPMETPWRALPAAILAMYLSGCQGGHAAADLLFGRVSPSGKLAETWPITLSDTPLGDGYPDFDREALYRESIFTGYRYYDAAGVAPAFPFGHGLSYARFLYSDLHVGADGSGIHVSCRVENRGAVRAAEVVQVYVGLPFSGAPREMKRLAAFKKVWLASGESAEVDLSLDEFSLRGWSAADHAWRVDEGVYTVMVGSSSRDIRLDSEICLGNPSGDSAVASCPREYLDIHPGCFDTDGFKRLYGPPLPARVPLAPFTIDSSASDMASTPFGCLVFHVVDRMLREPLEGMDEDTRAMMSEIVADTPLRSLLLSGFSMRTVEGLVDMLNGRYLRGLKAIVGAWRRARRALRQVGR